MLKIVKFNAYAVMNREGGAEPRPSIPGGRGQRGLWTWPEGPAHSRIAP